MTTDVDLLGGIAPRQKRRARTRKKVNPSSLLAFGATWCAPWLLVAKMLDTLEHEGVHVERVDVDSDPSNAERHRIVSLPTIIVLRDGVERRRLLGAVSLDELRSHANR